jgi:hypothetical protein
VEDKDADDVMILLIKGYLVFWYRMEGGLLFLRYSTNLLHVGVCLHGVSHCKLQHRQMECYLLKPLACRVCYRGNVGGVDIRAPGDYHGLDVVMNPSGRRRLLRRRPDEVGSSSNSCSITAMTYTFHKMILTRVRNEHTCT